MNSVPLDTVWNPCASEREYRNPILYADYSDPDVIRVGDRFYGTASSFVHTPGLPILESEDLVHWRLISYAIPRLPVYYDGPVRHGDGVWAPSIRYHDGWFWIFFSMPDEGIFMTRAQDPRGPWTPIRCVQAVKGWIDPCPLWDEDGSAYLVHAFAKSRCGIKSKLQLFRLRSDGSALVGDGRIIFDGTETQPTIEGPKLYKRNGWYYIFAPAGGVKQGWQTVLRSRSIWGPYEERIVLHQGNTAVNGPHQGAYVELEDGSGWFIHFQDRDAYGRIWHLQPVSWHDDWPCIGIDQNNDDIGEPVSVYPMPSCQKKILGTPIAEEALKEIGQKKLDPPTTTSLEEKANFSSATDLSDEFDGPDLALQWQWEGNTMSPPCSLKERESSLRLFAYPCPGEEFWLYQYPNILSQKFPAPQFTVDAVLTGMAGEEVLSGLMVCGETYYYLGALREEQCIRLVTGWGSKEQKDVLYKGLMFESEVFPLVFRLTIREGGQGAWAWSCDGRTFDAIGEPFQAVPGRWVGSRFGVFSVCIGDGGLLSGSGWADFERVEVIGPSENFG
ncbi:glycoside hydrolase 43 family protein [Treponema sp. J25]|uniref:glycoside hydrolase family 43 protein n=1 Tax=Treponema sp. J25 TaxID=2094121 RepID=UPI00104CFD63|nr:glycoside hydrolase 43 family protein [Treponema sp. J25]TCW60359.1 glycoside hydrolase [Treponema sp. J25]